MKFASNFTILYWIRKNANGVNGKKPLYCRITLNGQRTEIALGIYVEEKSFIKSSGFVKGASENAQLVNAQLDDIRNRLRHIYSKLADNEAVVTIEMIREAYLGNMENPRTLIEAVKWHNDMFHQKVKAGNRASGTMLKFNTTRSKIEGFVKWYFKTNDIPLANIKASFAEDFEHYLSVECKLEHNTVMKHIRNLKKVLGMAVQKEWILRNPISGYRCSYHTVERNILLAADLDRLIHTPLFIARLEEVRDCFVFMCYTGFAFQDAAGLSTADIKLMIDGERWLVTSRNKTNVKQSVPMLPVVETLIAKYSNHPYCLAFNRLLPFNSNQKMNAYLKEVGAICNIPFPLTTHLARHTFATSVTLANGVPLETVKELLGHRNIRTTHMYAKVLANKVSEDMKALKNKLAAATSIQSGKN